MISHRFSIALKLLETGFYFLLGALFLRYLISLGLGFVLLLIGIFLYLAVPLILGFSFPVTGGTPNPLLVMLTRAARSSGEIAIVFAGLLILLSGIFLFQTRLATRAVISEKKPLPHAPRKPFSLLSPLKPCWDTPYCRDFLTEFCSAYSKRLSCWKVGGGCLCDESIMNRLLARAQTDVKKTEGMSTPRWTSQLRQKKLDCGSCPIYAEHQRRKYRLVAPLIPLGVIALFWFARGGVHHYYISVAAFFDRLFSNLAYLPTTSGKVLGTLSTPWLEATILAMVALLLIGLLLHLFEYLVFSLGW